MTVLRVVVTRSGGFAGITVTAEVDDPTEAERLSAAVRSAAERPSGGARDDFVYEFTIVTSAATDRVDLTGAQLTSDLGPAVRTLFQRSRRAP